MGKILIIKGADFSKVSVDKINIIVDKIVINVIANPSNGGIVFGTGSYDYEEQVQISALASYGYKFKQWNDGNTDYTRTITVYDTSQTYTATFMESNELDEVGGWMDIGQMYHDASSVYTVSIIEIPTGSSKMNVVGADEPGTTEFVFLTSLPTFPTIKEPLKLANNSSLDGWDRNHSRVLMNSGETKEFTIPTNATCLVFNCKYSETHNNKPRSVSFS